MEECSGEACFFFGHPSVQILNACNSRGNFFRPFYFSIFYRTAKLLHRFCVTTVMSMKLRGNGSVFLFALNTGMMGKGIPNRSRI